MNNTFGELMAEAMAEKRWSDYQLSAAIGLLPGNKVFNNVQVRRLRRGERRNLDHELVERLIETLDLDPAEAWAAAGLLPPGVDADMLRKLDVFAASRARELVATQGRALTGRYLIHAGQYGRDAILIPFRPRDIGWPRVERAA